MPDDDVIAGHTSESFDITTDDIADQSEDPAGQASAVPEAEPPLHCTLVLLKTGPRTEPLTPAERSEVFGGHFANMQRLAREGHLLVAGPYGANDASLRGLFVLDTAQPELAKVLAETDPGFRAGVFAFEFHALETEAPLRAFLAAELEAQDEAERAGRVLQPGEGGRTYTLLTAEDGDAAAAPDLPWVGFDDQVEAVVRRAERLAAARRCRTLFGRRRVLVEDNVPAIGAFEPRDDERQVAQRPLG